MAGAEPAVEPEAEATTTSAVQHALIATTLADDLVRCHAATEDELHCANPFCERVWDWDGPSDSDYCPGVHNHTVRAMREKQLVGKAKTEAQRQESGGRCFRVGEDVYIGCHGTSLKKSNVTIKTHLICSDCFARSRHRCLGGACFACEVRHQHDAAVPDATAANDDESRRQQPARGARAARAAAAGSTSQRPPSSGFQPPKSRAELNPHVCESVMNIVRTHHAQGTNVDQVRDLADDAKRSQPGSGSARRVQVLEMRKELRDAHRADQVAQKAVDVATEMQLRVAAGVTREVRVNENFGIEEGAQRFTAVDTEVPSEDLDQDALDAEDDDDAETHLESVHETLETLHETAADGGVERAKAEVAAFRERFPKTADLHLGPAPSEEDTSKWQERLGEAKQPAIDAREAYLKACETHVPQLSTITDDEAATAPPPAKKPRAERTPEAEAASERRAEFKRQEREDLGELMKTVNEKAEDEFKREFKETHQRAVGSKNVFSADWEDYEHPTIKDAVKLQVASGYKKSEKRFKDFLTQLNNGELGNHDGDYLATWQTYRDDPQHQFSDEEPSDESSEDD